MIYTIFTSTYSDSAFPPLWPPVLFQGHPGPAPNPSSRHLPAQNTKTALNRSKMYLEDFPHEMRSEGYNKGVLLSTSLCRDTMPWPARVHIGLPCKQCPRGVPTEVHRVPSVPRGVPRGVPAIGVHRGQVFLCARPCLATPACACSLLRD